MQARETHLHWEEKPLGPQQEAKGTSWPLRVAFQVQVAGARPWKRRVGSISLAAHPKWHLRRQS